MQEKFSEEKNEQQVRNEEDITRLICDIKYKNPFEITVFEMLGMDPLGDTSKEDAKRIEEYSGIIRAFITDTQNTEIRNLIVQRDFKKAAEIMVTELERLDSFKKAA